MDPSAHGSSIRVYTLNRGRRHESKPTSSILSGHGRSALPIPRLRHDLIMTVPVHLAVKSQRAHAMG
jgi:hypothetical protein